MKSSPKISLLGLAAFLSLVAFGGWFLLGDKVHRPNSTVSESSEDADSSLEVDSQPAAVVDGEKVHDANPLRQETQRRVILRLPAVQADTRPGLAQLVERTPELEQRRSHGTFVGGMLLQGAIVQSQPVTGPELTFILPSNVSHREMAAMVEVPGFAPAVVSLTGESTTIELAEVEPVTILVVDKDANPVQEAACWFMTAVKGAPPADWIQDLRQSGFQAHGFTDGMGRMQFLSPRLGKDNQVQVVPPGDLATQGILDIEPGQTVTVVCSPGFSVMGSVLSLKTGEPLPGATVLAVGRSNQENQSLGTAVADLDGRFRFEGLPTGYSSIFLEGESEGYAFERVELMTPNANESREVHFRLVSAVDTEFVVQTPWGEPVAGCSVSIREERRGLTLDGIESDADGVVLVAGRLRPDRMYQVILSIGDWIGIGEQILVPGKTEKITISRVARVESLDLHGLPEGFEPQTIHWEPSSAVRPGSQAWPANAPSPLLPSGPGYWVLEGAGGQRLGLLGAIPEGSLESLRLDFIVSDFTFELPEGGPYSMSLRGIDGDSLIAEDGLEGGNYSYAAVPGAYRLRVWGEELDRDWANLVIPEGGRDLGLIEGFEYCGIEGRVTGANGKALPGITVSAYGEHPFATQHEATGPDGTFELGGMSPGAYFLVIQGGDAYGTLVVDYCAPVTLRPGQWLGPLEVQAAIPDDNAELQVTWNGPLEEGATAWVVRESSSLVRVFHPTGHANFPGSTVDGNAYGVAFAPGIMMVQAGRFGPSDSKVQLARGQVTNLVRCVDERGVTRTDLGLHLVDQGLPLHYICRPDENGQIRVTASLGLNLEVRVRQYEGKVYAFPLDHLLRASELVIPRNLGQHPIRVTDLGGDPMRSAVAMKVETGEFHHADGYGVVHLSFKPNEPYYIEAPGYLGKWVAEPQSDPIELPFIVYDARFSPPYAIIESLEEAVSVIRITPLDLGEDTAFPDHVDLAWKEEFPLIFPPLPEGGVRVQWLSADGEELWAKDFLLRDHDQVLD